MIFQHLNHGDQFFFLHDGFRLDRIHKKIDAGSYHTLLPGGGVSAAQPCQGAAEVFLFDLFLYRHPQKEKWNWARLSIGRRKRFGGTKTYITRTYHFKQWFDTEEEAVQALKEDYARRFLDAMERLKNPTVRARKPEPSPLDPRNRGGRKRRVIRKGGEFGG